METSNVNKTDDTTGFLFISYSREDKKIVEAIQGSIAFIIVLSPNSIKSENVRKELDLAEGVNKRIIPMDIELITLPSDFNINLQWRLA